MACYHPMTAYRSRSGRSASGAWPLTFNITKGYSDMQVIVPCGQCIGCRLEKSRQWAVRCIHEVEMAALEGKSSCFLTLTYNDDNYPDDGSLNKRDITLFLKRLRKHFGDRSFRYFQCGEYGEVCKHCGKSEIYCKCGNYIPSLGRPHHHALIFGLDLPDKKLWSVKRGVALYRSKLLERLWPHGYATIGSVTFESAAYVARYCTKKITGDMAPQHYGDKQPEFITMSRRPGLGGNWFKKFSGDVYPADLVHVRKDIIARPPKYYDGLYEKQDSESFRRIKAKRMLKASESVHNDFERLAVREAVQIAKFKKLPRKLEKEVLEK